MEDMDVFREAVVLYERHGGLPAVSVLPVATEGQGLEGLHVPGAAADRMYQVRTEENPSS